MTAHRPAAAVLTRAALPRMLADGGGAVVFTTSEARIVSEHEIVGMVEDLAGMYRDQGIRANAISTGPAVNSAEPEEQAAAIVFRASDAARDINGTVLPVVGGRTTD